MKTAEKALSNKASSVNRGSFKREALAFIPEDIFQKGAAQSENRNRTK